MPGSVLPRRKSASRVPYWARSNAVVSCASFVLRYEREIRMRTSRSALSLIPGLCMLAASVAVQTYPDQPVRLIGSLPGGGADLIMRLVAPSLRESLGQ